MNQISPRVHFDQKASNHRKSPIVTSNKEKIRVLLKIVGNLKQSQITHASGHQKFTIFFIAHESLSTIKIVSLDKPFKLKHIQNKN